MEWRIQEGGHRGYDLSLDEEIFSKAIQFQCKYILSECLKNPA